MTRYLLDALTGLLHVLVLPPQIAIVSGALAVVSCLSSLVLLVVCMAATGDSFVARVRTWSCSAG